MKVFLDTNIILDLLLEREGYEASAQLFQLQEEGKVELSVSILTMVNAAFVYKKSVGPQVIVPNLKYLSTLVEVLPMDNDTLQQSLYLNGKDFEDILQYMCAVQNHCDVVVTRNEKDFKIKEGLKALPPSVPVMSPDALVKMIFGL